MIIIETFYPIRFWPVKTMFYRIQLNVFLKHTLFKLSYKITKICREMSKENINHMTKQFKRFFIAIVYLIFFPRHHLSTAFIIRICQALFFLKKRTVFLKSFQSFDNRITFNY